MVKLTEFKRFIGRSKQEMRYFLRFTQVFASVKAKWTISLLSFVASSVFQAIWQSYFASNHCQIGLRPNAEFFPFPRNAEKRRRSNSKMNYEKIKKQIVTLANTSINLTFFLRKFILIISLRHVSLRLKTKLAHG